MSEQAEYMGSEAGNEMSMKRGAAYSGSWFALSLALYFPVSSELLGYKVVEVYVRLLLEKLVACQSGFGHALGWIPVPKYGHRDNGRTSILDFEAA